MGPDRGLAERLRPRSSGSRPRRREGRERLWGVLDYNAEEARAFRVQVIRELLEAHDWDGVFLCTRSQSKPARHGDQFGYNEPSLARYRARFGAEADPRDPAADLDAWREVRGEGLTQLLRDVRALTDARGKAARDRHPARRRHGPPDRQPRTSTGGPGSTSAWSTPSSSASSPRSARRRGSTSGPSTRSRATSSTRSASSASDRSSRISTRSSAPPPRTPASSCSCRACTTTRPGRRSASRRGAPAPCGHPVLDLPAGSRGRRGRPAVEADAALARRPQLVDPDRGLVRLDLPDGAVLGAR